MAAYFMGRMAAHLNKRVAPLSYEVLALMRAYDWPGNVRELEHVVQRAVIVCRGPAIRAEDIVLEAGKEAPVGELVPLEEQERRYIRQVLERTGGVIKGPGGAAAVLGLPESTLRSRWSCWSRRGDAICNRGGRLVLDLEGVQNIDAAGAGLLRRWSTEGLRLCGGSVFVRALLKA